MRAILLCTRSTNSTFGPEVVKPWLPSSNFGLATVHCSFMPKRPRVCLNKHSKSLNTQRVTAPQHRLSLAFAFANCKGRFTANHLLISDALEGLPKHCVEMSAIWAPVGLAVSAYSCLHKTDGGDCFKTIFLSVAFFFCSTSVEDRNCPLFPKMGSSRNRQMSSQLPARLLHVANGGAEG